MENEEKLTQAEKMTDNNSLDIRVNQAYIEIAGEDYATAEHAQEAYQGQYSSDEDFVKELLDGTGEIPSDMPPYVHIDWEWTAREIMMDYTEQDGYYFRNL